MTQFPQGQKDNHRQKRHCIFSLQMLNVVRCSVIDSETSNVVTSAPYPLFRYFRFFTPHAKCTLYAHVHSWKSRVTKYLNKFSFTCIIITCATNVVKNNLTCVLMHNIPP